MTDAQLQLWVERISLESFGVPFLHRAAFNSRLRTTGGRYLLKSHNIEISRKQYDAYGTEEIEKIIKHELCHYHLHLQRKGYRHTDADFQQLLAKVGGSRYCQAIPGVRRTLPVKYKLICLACGMEYPRKRSVDARRYRCGNCRGRLKLLDLD